jgi:uncharacterized phage-associated protein
MNNGTATQVFFSAIDKKTKSEILNAIASHYGITLEDALDEVTHEEAEYLLDYLTGSVRTATSVLMRRHGLGQPVEA